MRRHPMSFTLVSAIALAAGMRFVTGCAASGQEVKQPVANADPVPPPITVLTTVAQQILGTTPAGARSR